MRERWEWVVREAGRRQSGGTELAENKSGIEEEPEQREQNRGNRADGTEQWD